jgi:hypothetical protein
MARDRREQVIERAVRTTARQLRRRRGREGTVMPVRTPRAPVKPVAAATRKAA